MINEGLRYTKEHEWLSVEGSVATIGITDFAQSELGDVVFVELPSVGTGLSSGDSFGTIEAVKTVAELFAPVSGEVIAVNEQLESDAALVNTDCYGEGWMIQIQMSDPSEVDEMLTAEDYSEMTES